MKRFDEFVLTAIAAGATEFKVVPVENTGLAHMGTVIRVTPVMATPEEPGPESAIFVTRGRFLAPVSNMGQMDFVDAVLLDTTMKPDSKLMWLDRLAPIVR